MKKYTLSKYLWLFTFILLLSCNHPKHSIEKTNCQIEIQAVESKSLIEEIFPFITESLSVIAVFIGILITYPLLKKKLVESHITTTLQNIQDTNRLIQIDCQRLIDKYIPSTYYCESLRVSEIESVYDEIRKLYYKSQQSSSDVVTILFYLKNTLQGILKHYTFGKYAAITSSNLYCIVISTLELTIFYCSKVVQIPKSTKIETHNIINPKLKKFVTNSSSNQYKYFSQGVINDARTSHLEFFYEHINKCNHPLIKRAAFRIFKNPAPIANLLYLNEIYAPLILEKKNNNIAEEEKQKLFLIGFSFRKIQSTKDGSVRKVIDLDYCNPYDFVSFTDKLKIDDFKSGFRDTYIQESAFSFDKISLKASNLETISIQMEAIYLKNKFKSLKKKMIKQMKQICKIDYPNGSSY